MVYIFSLSAFVVWTATFVVLSRETSERGPFSLVGLLTLLWIVMPLGFFLAQ